MTRQFTNKGCPSNLTSFEMLSSNHEQLIEFKKRAGHCEYNYDVGLKKIQ